MPAFSPPTWWRIAFLLIAAWTALGGNAASAGTPIGKPPAPSEQETARKLDSLLLKTQGLPALPIAADDESFCRRAGIDLTGKTPSPEELRKFAADQRPDKRSRLIDQLLGSEAYAVNWGRYWRDTLTYHTPASGNYLRWQMFDEWMTEQFRQNRRWDEIVTALLTATGINDECAPVNFLTALYGNPIEVAATSSRVFLGVQLQCAQCHHAKTEPWKREQFHEFVAFFGRMRIIQHKDVDGRGTPYAIDGRADGQYRMPDKRNPSKLIVMTPRFLTGESVSLDADDAARRAEFARLLTSPKNPWFARAFVNRMWTALMGWGFYPTVNDVGGERPPRLPEVLDHLTRAWTATGYDVRWLFRTLANTEIYQRQLQPGKERDSLPPLAICPTRMRPEQIFESLVRALGVDEKNQSIPAPAPSSAPAVARHTGLRNMVYQTFKVDPSLPSEEIQGTIPQALLMMNSVLVNTYVRATGATYLAGAIKTKATDEEIITGLYERTLARRPSSNEMETCQRYIKRNGDRAEALEDIFWGLLNTTEFLTKR